MCFQVWLHFLSLQKGLSTSHPDQLLPLLWACLMTLLISETTLLLWYRDGCFTSLWPGLLSRFIHLCALAEMKDDLISNLRRRKQQGNLWASAGSQKPKPKRILRLRLLAFLCGSEVKKGKKQVAGSWSFYQGNMWCSFLCVNFGTL